MSEPNNPFPSPPPPPSGMGSSPFPPAPPPGSDPFAPRPFPTQPTAPGMYGVGPSGPGTTPARSGMAVAALVLGLLSLVLFFTLIVPVLALIFGLISASSIKKSAGRVTGLKMARAGWILGVLGVAGFIAIIVAVAVDESNDTDVSLDELEVGSCYDLPQSDEILELSSLDEVPCADPHRGELFHEYEMNPDRDREYPGQDALFEELGTECTGEVWTDYVGLEYAQSEFEVYLVIPVELNWRLARGGASCFIVDANDGELTGSAQDSGR